MESIITPTITAVDIVLDRAFYRPGEEMTVSVAWRDDAAQMTEMRLRAKITHLTAVLDTIEQAVTVGGDKQTAVFTYTPPASPAPRGYGLDVCLETTAGEPLACARTAFDVLEMWTQTPRYGFLSDFAPGRDDAEATLDSLVRYHINGLQFYDWMYRHEQLLTEDEPYTDLLGRRLSLVTTERLIAAAHDRNMAAMPYTAVYAASIPFYEDHRDWALYEANGKPHYFGENFLVYMDPRSDSDWTKHLLDQFDQVLRQTEFDGIHLDQYGAPKEAFDRFGHKFNLAQPLADLIDATKSIVDDQRTDGAVVFNAVTNWPVETVAPANQSIVYIEVWEPYVWFEDLHLLVTQAQVAGGGKPVVLAAYIDPAWEPNMRLMDAIIFASGGGRIELGEQVGVLADPYFPKYKPMTAELAEVMRRNYDFYVRYQDVIGPRTQDATQDYLRRIQVEGVSTSPSQRQDKVWSIVREGDRVTAVSLINMLGIEQIQWEKEVPDAPRALGETAVTISGVENEIAHIWFATPDNEDITPQLLDYTITQEANQKTIAFTIPSLSYWDLIVIEWVH